MPFKQRWYVDGEPVMVMIYDREHNPPHVTVLYRNVRPTLRISIVGLNLMDPKPRQIPQWIVNGLVEKVQRRQRRLLYVWERRTGLRVRVQGV